MSNANEWQRFFDAHAPEYMSNVFTKNTIAEVEFIINELNLTVGSSILDIGCGTGRHAVELARRGCRVAGIDLSSGMLAQAEKAARSAGAELELAQADAAKFQTGKKFDAAICLCEGAFGLLGSDDDPGKHDLAILRNINNALKPGGGFLLTALNGYRLVRKYTDDDVAAGRLDPVYIVEKYDMEYETPEGKKTVALTERSFAPGELLLMFRLAGFEVNHIGGGTAGNWGKRPIELDEYELMVIARKSS